MVSGVKRKDATCLVLARSEACVSGFRAWGLAAARGGGAVVDSGQNGSLKPKHAALNSPNPYTLGPLTEGRIPVRLGSGAVPKTTGISGFGTIPSAQCETPFTSEHQIFPPPRK